MNNESKTLDEILGTLRFGDGYCVIKKEAPSVYDEWKNRPDMREARTAITALMGQALGKDYLVCELYPDAMGTYCNKCNPCYWRNNDDYCNGYENRGEVIRQRLQQLMGDK